MREPLMSKQKVEITYELETRYRILKTTVSNLT